MINTAVNEVYCDLVNVLCNATNLFVPERKKNFYKFWWSEELSLLKEESIESNKIWKAAGKPRSGPIFAHRQKCRLQYRRQLRERDNSNLSIYTNELHENLLNKNGPAFWKCWKSKFGKGNSNVEVDGCVDNNVVADKFADHFAKAYSCNNATRAAELNDEYIDTRATYQGLPLTESFDVETISVAMAKLKLGKAPDLDRLTSEHLLYSHPILSCILYKLFNVILFTGIVPQAFGRSYTVPLCKLNDSRTKAVTTDDFRGIAISPVISKLFEHCFLVKFGEFLHTHDNQYGFKKSLGCNNAIFHARTCIDRFVHGGSTMNLCTLDLSKAFDKVNHSALLLKLMKRNIPVELIRILENWFSICFTCVKWNSVYSRFFKIDYGVRQGSVLSPSLFAVYIDDIVNSLSVSQRHFIILYADDILIMAPSVTELQKIISMCEHELQLLDMMINVNKSCCLRIGPRYAVNCTDILTHDGHPIPWVDSVRYLGVFIVQSSKFKCSLDNAKRSFHRSVNAIFSKIGRSASEEVFLQLVSSKCLPVLLYALEVCPLNKADLCSLDFTVNRVLMKLFRTSNIEIVLDCRMFFNFKLPSEILPTRYNKFISNMHVSASLHNL